MEDKKLNALLKQARGWSSSLPIRGVARFNEQSREVNLSILNLEKKSGGEYYFVFGKEFFKIDGLDGGEFFVEKYCECPCIVFYDKKQVFLVAIGGFKYKFDEYEVFKNAQELFKKEDYCKEEGALFQTERYFDDAIAQENYYEFDRISKEGEDESNTIKESYNAESSEKQEEKEGDFRQDEPFSTCNCKGKKQEEYYLKIKDELDKIFKQYPKENNLCKMVENSFWVKIGDSGKFYAVGVLLNGKEVEYVCYGLPGNYYKKPDAKGFSSFIPISPFDLKGEGYWVTFQNASSGELVFK